MNEYNFSSIEELPGLSAKVAFLKVDSEAVFREDENLEARDLGDGTMYMPWGADDELPYNVLDMIEKDETMTTCLQFGAETCYGSGLRYNTEGASAKVSEEVEDFTLDNLMPAYFLGVCQDLKHYGFAVSVIILNQEGSKIVSLERKNALYCRFTKANDRGVIEQVLYGAWRKKALGPEDVEKIDLLNPSHPWRDLAIRMGRMAGDDGLKKVRTEKRKFAILTKIPTADSTYYPIPFYASLFRSKWYDIKQLIGMAKKLKLQNSAPIRYHIEIGHKYFENLFRSEGITDPLKKKERTRKFKDDVIQFLTGIENSGKVWFSTFYVTPDGKEQHEVVINKIDTDKEGGDWESDIQEAVNMMCFALRVHSNLVGSVPGKAQTNNSGSDKRELYTIAHALQKPYHDLLFIPHRIIIRFNGWQGVVPECPFVQLTTLDENTDAKEVKPEQ